MAVLVEMGVPRVLIAQVVAEAEDTGQAEKVEMEIVLTVDLLLAVAEAAVVPVKKAVVGFVSSPIM